MPELHNTVMGKRLIEHTLPEIARQLERIANVLEEKNTPKSFKTFVDHYQDDKELGKKIREIWQK